MPWWWHACRYLTMQGWLGSAHLPPQIAIASSIKALSCEGIATHLVSYVVWSTDDVGAGGAGVGGSAATRNMNGKNNVGSVVVMVLVTPVLTTITLGATVLPEVTWQPGWMQSIGTQNVLAGVSVDSCDWLTHEGHCNPFLSFCWAFCILSILVPLFSRAMLDVSQYLSLAGSRVNFLYQVHEWCTLLAMPGLAVASAGSMICGVGCMTGCSRGPHAVHPRLL